MGARPRSRRVGRRLRLARYWLADGDLDQAALHGHHALRLVRAGPAAPTALAAEVAIVVARIDRDRDDAAASRAALAWAVAVLDAAPASSDRDRLLARALTDFGDGHRRAGRYRQAVDTLGRARQLTEATEAADPMELAATLTVLGIVAKELGAFDQAAHWYAKVAGVLRTAGATPADAATLQHNLAGLAYARQRYPRAESHARRAVALRWQAPGATEVEVAADVAVLAAAVAGQGRHDEARELLTRAMAACRRARPPRRYEIAVHLHNLAAIDQATGRAEQAERRYRQALALKEELLGPDHPEVALVANNLATLLHEQRRDPEAARCYGRALAIVERSYPPGHPVTAAIRDNLSRVRTG